MNEMDKVAKRIKDRRIELGMSQDALAKALGYTSRSSINKIEKNAQLLPQKKVMQIAKALRVSPGYLMGWDDEETKSSIKIPVLGDVAAGVPIDAVENVIDYEEIPERYGRMGEFFALRIHGDSMEPRICEGDIVIVKQQPDAESGDVCIVRVSRDTATCKILRKYADGAVELVSINPSYEPMFYSREQVESEPVEVVGVVIENRQKYKQI